MLRTSSLVLIAVAGCADDPVAYSSPVAINLKAESGAVNGTAISDEKSITTESGNPYGAFVSNARARLGRDPGRIEVDGLTLTLGGQSTGVTTLEQVYTGSVDVLFVSSETNNTYPVGSVANPAGAGPINIIVSFDSDAVAAQDWSKFVGGNFKVLIRGTAASGFEDKGAKADLQLTFTFAAYE